jgi:hypothetical protein
VSAALSGAIRHPRSRAGGWPETGGIQRHKAWCIRDLRSSDLSSAHPKRAPFRIASGPSEMARKTSQKGAMECHLAPFLCHSYVTLFLRLAVRPHGHPNNAGLEPGPVPRELPQRDFKSAELYLERPRRARPDEHGHRSRDQRPSAQKPRLSCQGRLAHDYNDDRRFGCKSPVGAAYRETDAAGRKGSRG